MRERTVNATARVAVALLSTGVLSIAVACTPTAPTPPVPGPLTIACPASMTVPSPNGGAAEVVYAKPRVTGGTLPVTNRCTPTIGASFNVGTTRVACLAQDAAQRSASCSFDVTVVVPRLRATSFVAFGDSITEGKDGICGSRTLQGLPFPSILEDLERFERLRVSVNPPSVAYPAVLRELLINRYRLQSFVVVNQGKGGEAATGSATQARLDTVLDTYRPEVLLLQEGVNDLHGNRSITSIANALRTMVRKAKGRGIPVFLGTLLPERVGSCRADAPERIVPMNVQIRAVAASEGATLVDLYAAFVGQEATLLDPDGLHASIAGYAKIAETFFNAIRTQLEEQ